MALEATNFAKSTLAAGINMGATSLTIQAGDVAKFPAGGPFRAVLWSPQYSTPLEATQVEIVELTWSAGNTYTCSKAQEGTGDYVWQQGTIVLHAFTAAYLAQFGISGTPQFARLGVNKDPALFSEELYVNGQMIVNSSAPGSGEILVWLATPAATCLKVEAYGAPALHLVHHVAANNAMYVEAGRVKIGGDSTPISQFLAVYEVTGSDGAIFGYSGSGHAVGGTTVDGTAIRGIASDGLAAHFSGGANFSVYIENMFRLAPQSLPAPGVQGRFIVDSSDGLPKYDDGVAWKTLAFV